jgi:hypothetical protein
MRIAKIEISDIEGQSVVFFEIKGSDQVFFEYVNFNPYLMEFLTEKTDSNLKHNHKFDFEDVSEVLDALDDELDGYMQPVQKFFDNRIYK